MCPLSCESGSDCDSSIYLEDRTSDAVDEGGTAFPPSDLNREIRLIRIANKKRMLLGVLQGYGITVERITPWDTWSAPIKCPFPMHKGGNERTPSFGYNFSSDSFNCFGCGLYGGTCEFVAAFEGVDKCSVAEQIIADSGGYELDAELDEDAGRYDILLYEFASFVSNAVQKSKDNTELIRKIDGVLAWIDDFILSKAPKKQITVEELEPRIHRSIDIIKGLLNE